MIPNADPILIGSYPNPSAAWVWGHLPECFQNAEQTLKDQYRGNQGDCTCPHGTARAYAIPEYEGVGRIHDARLYVYDHENSAEPNDPYQPWRTLDQHEDHDPEDARWREALDQEWSSVDSTEPLKDMGDGYVYLVRQHEPGCKNRPDSVLPGDSALCHCNARWTLHPETQEPIDEPWRAIDDRSPQGIAAWMQHNGWAAVVFVSGDRRAYVDREMRCRTG